MVSYIRSLLTRMGVLASRPGVFFIIAVYALLWILLSPDTFEWHAAATLATWMMTVFIQRAEHRDTQAIHAKLDHLLEKLEPADGSLAGLDRMQPEDIERFRKNPQPYLTLRRVAMAGIPLFTRWRLRPAHHVLQTG